MPALSKIFHPAPPSSAWLRNYYLVRFLFSAVWVVVAFTVARASPAIAAVMLVIYPAWDAAANYQDATTNGGLLSNRSQAFNALFSASAAIAVAYALSIGMKPVLIVFGIWAFLAGVAQLVTGVRRWKTYGAQWVMILSGGQSALVAIHFYQQSSATPVPGIEAIAPYAALGAFYFLLSSVWLAVGNARRNLRSAEV
jgi:uncharacterized membrane protein HdeD (DUF308 family)